jgi:hypothetical protein
MGGVGRTNNQRKNLMQLKSGIIVLLLTGLVQTASADGKKVLQPLSESARQSLYRDAVRIADPGRLPDSLRAASTRSPKCGFQTIAAVQAHLHEFTEGERRVLSVLFERPSLPHSIVSPSGRFRVHYATEGSAAVPAEDADLNGVPDFPEEACRSLDHAYAVVVEQLGYRPPPEDFEDGPEWDCYCVDMGGDYGLTTPEDPLTSSDPYIWTSYMSIDHDFTRT